MKEKTYSKGIANVINNFFTEDDWYFSFDDQLGLFRFGLRINGRIKEISCIVDVKDNEYVVYAISPLGADSDDEKMMAVMSEFVCRANYGLQNGNFELDMRDGELRFKCFVDCEGIMPTFEMVRNSIYFPAAMFDRYGVGIVDIIFRNATAKKAIAKCEKSLVDELCSLLGEELGENDLCGSGAQTASVEEQTDIKTELFKAKGGAA